MRGCECDQFAMSKTFVGIGNIIAAQQLQSRAEASAPEKGPDYRHT